MSLDPRYIPLYNLQQYFVDKATGGPLSNGRVYFYSDENRSIPKTVYELSSTTGTYTYVPLPNPVLLSSVGTPVDVNGNDIVIYAFPFNIITGEPELYYVVVQDNLGRPQFTREAVPSNGSGGITPSSDAGIFNYIPNGQFLAHTNVPGPDNMLVAGTNVIAQGGFSVELAAPLVSENTYRFIEQQYIPGNPPNSPRFIGQLQAVTFSSTEDRKNLRIKFNDVNKFSANEDFYTFCFWGKGNIDIPIAIQVVKYCGPTGTIVAPVTVFTDVITTAGDLYQYQFQFGLNTGLVIDTTSNTDYVAIDIALPTGIPFIFDHTDFILANGEIDFTAFPLQTNADMITRGVDGWTDVPDYDGGDLYLPKVLTRIGYEYSASDVGDVGISLGSITSPLSLLPLPKGNKMPIIEASYPYSGFSTNGIPFSRLGDFLIENSSVPNIPMFGTGSDFATAYSNSVTDILRLTVNSSGVGAAYAQDGIIPTGITFQGQVVYNGSTTGSASLNYSVYSSGIATNQIICKSNFNLSTSETQFGPDTYCIDVDTGFTISQLDYWVNTYAEQGIVFTIDTVTAAALTAGTGNPGLTFYFYSANGATLPYYVWFNVTGEVDPGPPVVGALPIEVILHSTDTAEDVANTLREVMNAYQITSATFPGTAPIPGSYFEFFTNPSGVLDWYVWYSNQTGGSDPLVPGSTGINVQILSADTPAEVLTKTLKAINKYQYGIPSASGMFFRNYDPTGVWDFDNLTRFSNVTGIVGPSLGTFEYSQFLLHNHELSTVQAINTGQPRTAAPYSATPSIWNGVPINFNAVIPAGGSETRPVNMYVNYYIKY